MYISLNAATRRLVRTVLHWPWLRPRRKGDLQPGATIIEPTSAIPAGGGCGQGYKLILVMPDSMSIERRRLMLAYGAAT